MESPSLFSSRANIGMMVASVLLVLMAAGLAMFGAALGGPVPTDTDTYSRDVIGHRAFYDLMQKLGNRPFRLTSVQHTKVAAPIFFLEPRSTIRDRGRQVYLSNALLKRYQQGRSSVIVIPKWQVKGRADERRAESISTSSIWNWLQETLPKHIYDTLRARLRIQRVLANADIGKRTPSLQTLSAPFQRSFDHKTKTLRDAKPLKISLFLPQQFHLLAKAKPKPRPGFLHPLLKKLKGLKLPKPPKKPGTSTPPKGTKKPAKKPAKALVAPQIQVALGSAKKAFVLLLTAPKRGNIWLVSDPDLLHNFNLQRGEHAILWYTMAKKYLRHRPILIDECFHGHTKTFSLVEELATFPKYFLVIQALLLLACCGWYGGRRFGVHQSVEVRLGRGPQEVIGITAWVLVCGRRVEQVAASYVERTLEDTAGRFSLRENDPTKMARQLDRLAKRKGVEPAAESLQSWADMTHRQLKQSTKEALRYAHRAWQFRRAMLARKGARVAKTNKDKHSSTPSKAKRA